MLLATKHCLRFFNPLSAKPSFQLWYPGGQRLKVISFSWFWVKSPSKCFSNTEPTTIIASRDEKRCNAPVQRTRLVHSSSLRLSDQYRKCHGWLLFFAFPTLQAWPSCSCTSASAKTAKCETVATSGLGNRLLKTRWFVDDEGLSLRTITRWLPCFFFFFSFGPWIAAHDSCQSRRRSMVLLRSIAPMHGSRVFILVFDVPSPKCFAQLGDRHSGQVSNIGSVLEKRKEISKKILVVVVHVVGVRKKCPVTERSFQKDLQDIVETKSPRDWRFGAKSYKSAGNKKLFETDITLERKEIISSFERKSSLESLAQNILECPSPSHARNLSFTHDGYIRHTATEMIILMTDISVIWHSTG